ncbi:hypothetical protein [Nocardioides speluncae]|uniref:hypothetical protein n=1 Tax=Nocardioides speluncae TaxID=2670337 RepID=UPI000D69C6FD|nr:hypothetical protein [Nocardioides speluncae]
MSEFDLPPERRLPDGVKQQMKRDLINETAVPDESAPLRGRAGWLAAGVAAVAVAAVAVGGAVLLGGEEQSAPGPIAPAGSGTVNGPTPSNPPSEPADPKTMPGEGAYTTDVESLPPPEATSCEDEVAEFGQNQGLPGATKRATAPYEGGAMTLWGTDAWWVVCDDWAAANGGGKPTLIGNAPWSGTPSADTFRLSQNYSLDGGEFQVFSAGPRIPGVERIEYTFANGKQKAATFTDQMWSMNFFAPGSDAIDGAEVAVTWRDGHTDTYSYLGAEMCAQLNHGC